ncbi:serine O-acetyltransferase EpsC [Rhodovulum strictum]|uniref:serine O-acetyltransferase n=1 Tax=Rhodovulum strictum TaxID=58314 RepID=A0A844BFL7_9RHOB|nr:serine O-acetyltransferase EpsC [Rhodovulum strictum]MRH21389.1 serine acetyltransferase [Rhodovulum strictum]
MTLDIAAGAPDRPADEGFGLDRVLEELAEARRRWRQAHHRSFEPGGREMPALEAVDRIVEGLRGALFPMRLGPLDLRQESEDLYVGHTLDTVLHDLEGQVRLELCGRLEEVDALRRAEVVAQAHSIVRDFALTLPDIRSLLDGDVVAAYHADPAAQSVDEVLLCYPGLRAMIHHRIAHRLYVLGVPLLARMVSEAAHRETGIDIHPGATIGRNFFIDHGTGVVIGETALIGDNVRLFQAVTLGAKSFPVDSNGRVIKGQPRHPIVEDDVVIYAGATILGRVTIGRGAVIGGNVWLTEDVPPATHYTHSIAQGAVRPAQAGSGR